MIGLVDFITALDTSIKDVNIYMNPFEDDNCKYICTLVRDNSNIFPRYIELFSLNIAIDNIRVNSDHEVSVFIENTSHYY